MCELFKMSWWPAVRIVIHAAIATIAVYLIIKHEDGSSGEPQPVNSECSEQPASQSDEALRLKQHLTIDIPQCALYLDEDFK